MNEYEIRQKIEAAMASSAPIEEKEAYIKELRMKLEVQPSSLDIAREQLTEGFADISDLREEIEYDD